jgi:hypothetical protein
MRGAVAMPQSDEEKRDRQWLPLCDFGKVLQRRIRVSDRGRETVGG